MISRRGLFRLLSGAALSPVLKPLLKFTPSPRFKLIYLPRCHGKSIGRHYAYFKHDDLVSLRNNLSATQMYQIRDLPVRGGNPIIFFRYAPEVALDNPS